MTKTSYEGGLQSPKEGYCKL